VVDAGSAAAKRSGRLKANADASAEAVRNHRAPGDHPTANAESQNPVDQPPIQPVFDEAIQPDANADPSPSPLRSGGEGRGEVALRDQGDNPTRAASNLPDLILIDGGKGQLGM